MGNTRGCTSRSSSVLAMSPLISSPLACRAQAGSSRYSRPLPAHSSCLQTRAIRAAYFGCKRQLSLRNQVNPSQGLSSSPISFTINSPVQQLVFFLYSTWADACLLDNSNLIYAILRAHDRIQTLATLTLSSALSEIARAKAAKEEHVQRTGSSTPDHKSSHVPEPVTVQIPEDEWHGREALEEKQRVRDREVTIAANTVATDQSSPSQSPPQGELSEKARGKLKEGSSSIGSPASPGLTANAASILGYESASGFVATEEWVQSWVPGLPLDSILIAISEVPVQYLLPIRRHAYMVFSFCLESRRSKHLRAQLHSLRQPHLLVFYLQPPQLFLGGSNGQIEVRSGARASSGGKSTCPVDPRKVRGLGPRSACLVSRCVRPATIPGREVTMIDIHRLSASATYSARPSDCKYDKRYGKHLGCCRWAR